MFEKNVNKHYVSQIDEYLEQLRQLSISLSQKKEFQEYQKIIKLRDNSKK